MNAFFLSFRKRKKFGLKTVTKLRKLVQIFCLFLNLAKICLNGFNCGTGAAQGRPGGRVEIISPRVTHLDLLAVLEPLDLGLGVVHLALELHLPLRLSPLVLQLTAEPELWVWR